jgi:hypothetical protein
MFLQIRKVSFIFRHIHRVKNKKGVAPALSKGIATCGKGGLSCLVRQVLFLDIYKG